MVPVPNLVGARARFLAPPPPQPGMMLALLPPPTHIGAPTLLTMVLFVCGDVFSVAAPSGALVIPTDPWPPPSCVAVFSPIGEPLWRRPRPEDDGTMPEGGVS